MAKNYDSPWEEQVSAPTTPDTGKWKLYFKSTGLFIVDDAGTEYGPIQADASSEGEIFVGAVGMWPSTTSGAAEPAKTEHGTNDVDLYTVDFDQTTIEYAQFNVWMPDTWDAGTVTFKVGWTAAAGSAAQTVEWNLQARAYADDDAIDQAWGSSVEVSDALIATGDIHYSAESTAVTIAGTPAAGELVQFRVWRDASNDTLAADAKLSGLKIYYTKA